jgi:two-component system, sensor histidine kinase and response regulator
MGEETTDGNRSWVALRRIRHSGSPWLMAVFLGLYHGAVYLIFDGRHLGFANTASLFGLMVVYLSFRSGLPNGLFSAALALLYQVYFITQFREGFLSNNHRSVLSSILFSYPMVVVLVSLLHLRDQKRTRLIDSQRERLAEAERRYRSIYENAHEGIYQTSLDGILLTANPALAKIMGYDSPDDIVSTINDVSRDVYVEPGRRQAFLDVLYSHDEVSDFESQIYRKDGSVIWISEQARAIKNPEGEILYLEGSVIDITDRKQNEIKLRQHNEYLAALHETTLGLMNRLDPIKVLEGVLKRVSGMVGSEHSFICLTDESRDHLNVALASGECRRFLGHRVKRGEGIAGKVWETGVSQVVDDYKNWQGGIPRFQEEEFHAFIASPLKSGNRMVGVIGVSYIEKGRSFTAEQRSLLDELARLSSIALDNAKLHQALENTNRRLSEAQGLARLGSWELDLSTSQLTWSRTMYDLYGVDPSAFTPTYDNVLAMTHLDDRGIFEKQTSAAIAGNHDFEFDYRIVRPNGAIKYLHSRGRVASVKNGRPAVLAGAVLDVTDQKLTEDILRHSEEKFRALANNANDAIVSTDSTGRIIYANRSSERLFGRSSAEMMGRTLAILLPKGCQDEEQQGIKRYLPGDGADGSSLEVKGINAEGSEFPLEISLAGWQTKGEQFFTLIMRDITERQKLDDLRRDFVALVSHQLKTPLALIRGYTDNMLAGYTGELNEHQLQYLRDMQQVSVNSYRLISDLLNASRLERGVISMDIKPHRLKDIIETALRDHLPQIKDKNLELETKQVDDGIWVMSDAFKMAHAIGNIIDNAIKNTQQGKIVITTKSNGKMALAEITDTGKGMDKETLGRLFTRDQIMGGSPRPDTSSGLGLYIARNFMLLQNGDISVSSQSGKGSTFTLFVPLAKVESHRKVGRHIE